MPCPSFERAYGFRLRQDQIPALAGGNTAATLRAAARGPVRRETPPWPTPRTARSPVLGVVLLADPLRAQIVFQPAPVIPAPPRCSRRTPPWQQWLGQVFSRLDLSTLRCAG